MPSRERTLILTVGLPRSGKSTWSMRQMVPVANPDSVRRAIHGQAFVQDSEPLVWGVVDTMIRSLFIAGHETVILDATNIDRATRRRWVARGGYWHAAVMFKTAVERAAAESGEPPKFYGVYPDGVCSIFRAGGVAVLIRNLRGGFGPNAKI